jgi:DNA-binding response OmpR family regulator
MRNPKRILVIDDDIDLLMLLERKLDSQGFAVETAASIPAAKEFLPYWYPDLVLLDININGEDGRQLCYELKLDERLKETKVILISGYDPSYRRAVLFGADEVMPKPFDTGDLLAKINFCLEPQEALLNRTISNLMNDGSQALS